MTTNLNLFYHHVQVNAIKRVNCRADGVIELYLDDPRYPVTLWDLFSRLPDIKQVEDDIHGGIPYIAEQPRWQTPEGIARKAEMDRRMYVVEEEITALLMQGRVGA